MTAVVLREWQDAALARLDAAQGRGVTRALGVAATGLGKTVLFVEVARRRGGRTLILAHRDELIEQAAAKVEAMMPGVQVGRVKGKANEVRADVVVASVQTLSRADRLAQVPSCRWDPRDGSALFATYGQPFDLVVVDEAHHAAADSYRRILTHLGAGSPGCPLHGTDHNHERRATPTEVDAGCELGIAFDPCPGGPGPFVFGVTATPDRGDGAGLDDLFDEVVFSYDMLWGIRSGYLSDVRGMAVKVAGFHTEDLRTSKGDYDQGQAGALLAEAGAAQIVAHAWTQRAAGRRTLVFTPTVAFAEEVAAEFVGLGVRAGTVTGAMPVTERRDVLAAFARGDLQVLANCAVLTEGYDEPRVDCVVVARPTKSRSLYVQMIGRGTRLHPDKTDCLVLDLVGGASQHELVTISSLFGLGKVDDSHNGKRGIAALSAEYEAEQIRLGAIRAEDVDLFRKMRARGAIAWVAVHSEGAPLRRYQVRLPHGKPIVVLAQRVEGADVWTAGLLHADGTKRGLLVDVPLEDAQGTAEDYVRRHGGVIAAANASWRARRPSAKQVAAAKRWRVDVDPEWTAGDLSDAIDRKAGRVKGRHETVPRPTPPLTPNLTPVRV